MLQALRALPLALVLVTTGAVALAAHPGSPASTDDRSVPAAHLAIVKPQTEAATERLQLLQDRLGTRRAAIAAAAAAEAAARQAAAQQAAQAAAQLAAQAAAQQPAAQPAPAVQPGSIQDVISSAFSPLGSGAVSWALRVANCESHYNPQAVNGSSGASGLFQFLPSTWAGSPFTGSSVFDPAANARAAAWLYQRSGGAVWSCK
jgi:soluble lytic murein transglycosylase-like protein